MDVKPISRLFKSSKALMVMIIIVLTYIGLFMGKINWADMRDLLKWLVPSWLLAHGAEDVAKQVAHRQIKVDKTIHHEEKLSKISQSKLIDNQMD